MPTSNALMRNKGAYTAPCTDAHSSFPAGSSNFRRVSGAIFSRTKRVETFPHRSERRYGSAPRTASRLPYQHPAPHDQARSTCAKSSIPRTKRFRATAAAATRARAPSRQVRLWGAAGLVVCLCVCVFVCVCVCVCVCLCVLKGVLALVQCRCPGCLCCLHTNGALRLTDESYIKFMASLEDVPDPLPR